MDHGLPSTLGYVGVMNYVLIEVKAMPKALVGSPAEHSWCDSSNLYLSTARCRQFIARFMCMGLKANSQFIQVILWKILLPLSETTGYKNTGHNNNFSSGILSIIRVQNSSQVLIGNINREINYTMTKPIELFNTMFFFVTIGFPGISLCSLITLRWFLVS